MKKNHFHHGNLRMALIYAAIETVHTHGIEQLSMRQLAQQLDVSPAAPYRHFLNKNKLIEELIEVCSSEMVDAYQAAIASSKDSEQRLYQGCAAYLHFAIEKTNMFNMLFSDYAKLSALSQQSLSENNAFRLFHQLVTDLIHPDVPKAQHTDITVSCWALLHGFATLRTGGNAEMVNYSLDKAIAAVITLAKSPRG